MDNEYKKILLEVVEEYSKKGSGFFQSIPILLETANRLNIRRNNVEEQALLSIWNDLFRMGYLGWGHNIDNAKPPFIHLSSVGRKALESISRDPANPDGYMSNLRTNISINPIAESYITESLMAFNSNCFKSAAVMVGGATESLVLELRNSLVNKMNSNGTTIPRKLKDWRVKTVLDKIKELLDARKSDIPNDLWENYNAYWNAITHMIRIIRNEAGHPVSITPVTDETVHSSLLLFPEITKLTYQIIEWVDNNY